MINLGDVGTANLASQLTGSATHVAQAGAILLLLALFVEPIDS